MERTHALDEPTADRMANHQANHSVRSVRVSLHSPFARSLLFTSIHFSLLRMGSLSDLFAHVACIYLSSTAVRKRVGADQMN